MELKEIVREYVNSYCYRFNSMAFFVWWLAVLMPLAFGIGYVVLFPLEDSIILRITAIFLIVTGSINLCTGIYSLVKNLE